MVTANSVTAPADYTLSRVLSMQGSNSLQAGVTVDTLIGNDGGAATLQFNYQASFDMQGWTDIGSPTAVSSVGYALLSRISNITRPFVRLAMNVSDFSESGGICVLSLSVDTSRQ